MAAGTTRVTSIPEEQRVTAGKLATFRRIFPARDLGDDGTPKNERAVFVLSPPRSGSTLLRILLAGNSGLFAPPEPAPAAVPHDGRPPQALAGAHTDHLLEGTARALMQLNGWSAEQSLAFVADCEARNMTTKAFYRELQAPLKGERLLVDKTPWYIVDVDILKRIERDFVDPLYIHRSATRWAWCARTRNPRCSACCRSPRRKAASAAASWPSLTWLLAQQNVREIAKDVPPGRWLQVRYEDLVVQPEAVLRRVRLPRHRLRGCDGQSGTTTWTGA